MCSSKCLTNLKGLPLVVVFHYISRTQGINGCVEDFIWIFIFNGRGGGRHQRIVQTQPQKKWPSCSSTANEKGGRACSLVLVFKNVVFSVFEVVKDGQCSNFNRPYNLMQASFFLLLRTRWGKITNLNQTEVPPCQHDLPDNAHTDISTLFILWLSCSGCFTRERVNTNTHRLTPVCWKCREGGGRKDAGRTELMNEGVFFLIVMYSKVLSACESQTHCVLQVPINSVL